MNTKIRTVVLGASGYTGADAVRLLLGHPQAEIVGLSAERHAGQDMAAVFPHLRFYDLPRLQKVSELSFDEVDAVICCLPHATTQAIVSTLPQHVKIVDLSADFRLRDAATYAEWYGGPHQAEQLQREAVYGLSEHYREDIKAARLVACPGCYPTATLLALLPLLKAGAIKAEDIIIDAKSGVSGAGRGLAEAKLFTEIAEGLHPYKVGAHRHMPEIEQELGVACGEDVRISFTPHLVPMNRGELVTCYVRLADDATIASLRETLSSHYEKERFVHLLPEGEAPQTRHVRGSNHCEIGVFADRIPGRAIVISAIDNLVKGSSGQALQNFNLMFDLPEHTGLTQAPLFP